MKSIKKGKVEIFLEMIHDAFKNYNPKLTQRKLLPHEVALIQFTFLPTCPRLMHVVTRSKN
jgi:hypothetical protein